MFTNSSGIKREFLTKVPRRG